MALTGHAVSHSPHRVHAARKAISGNAPGGRTNSLAEYFFSTTSAAFPSTFRKPNEKKARRSSGLSLMPQKSVSLTAKK